MYVQDFYNDKVTKDIDLKFTKSVSTSQFGGRVVEFKFNDSTELLG